MVSAGSYWSKLSRRCEDNETGSEVVEFIFVFPLLLFTVFAGVDFGWVFYQKIAFEYALAATSWNIDPSRVYKDTEDDQRNNIDVVKSQITQHCPDIISSHLTITPSMGSIEESNGMIGDLPVLQMQEYESSMPLTAEETEQLGLKSRRYVHSYIHVQAHYEYEIDWIIGFGEFLGVHTIEGDINELRTCGKDFYFSPQAAENA